MDSPTLCEQVCTDSGWVAQLFAFVLIAGRGWWLARRNAAELAGQTKKTEELEKKVEQLSIRPPPMNVAPLAVQLGPEQIEGLATALRPSLTAAWLKAGGAEPLDLEDGPTEPPPPRAK